MTVAVVTGSSTGIGYATALRLARDGHHVVATMRTPASCDIEQAAKDEGLDLEARALDVDDDASVDALFKDVGDVDVLVNNAGISIGRAMEEASLDDYRQTMETNFFGTIRCTKAVLPSMRERGSGCIATVTSQAGRLAVPTLSPYSASKWALESAMEALAAEVAAFGIRVVLIEPGAITTPIIGKSEFPSPDSVYMPVYVKFGTIAIHDFGNGSAPEVVADCVAEAIAAEPYRLRWLTGQGAERNIRVRAAMSDEESIGLWGTADNDEFRKTMLADEA
jgi:NAD(P)-dependent dehydrogenase (short-subunit alcohol dehydrogenase family)